MTEAKVIAPGATILQISSVDELAAKLKTIKGPIKKLHFVGHMLDDGTIVFQSQNVMTFVLPANLAAAIKDAAKVEEISFQGCEIGQSPSEMHNIAGALSATKATGSNCSLVNQESDPVKVDGKPIVKPEQLKDKKVRTAFENVKDLRKKFADKSKKCIMNDTEEGYFKAGGKLFAYRANPASIADSGTWDDSKSICYTDLKKVQIDPTQKVPVIDPEDCKLIRSKSKKAVKWPKNYRFLESLRCQRSGVAVTLIHLEFARDLRFATPGGSHHGATCRSVPAPPRKARPTLARREGEAETARPKPGAAPRGRAGHPAARRRAGRPGPRAKGGAVPRRASRQTEGRRRSFVRPVHGRRPRPPQFASRRSWARSLTRKAATSVSALGRTTFAARGLARGAAETGAGAGDGPNEGRGDQRGAGLEAEADRWAVGLERPLDLRPLPRKEMPLESVPLSNSSGSKESPSTLPETSERWRLRSPFLFWHQGRRQSWQHRLGRLLQGITPRSKGRLLSSSVSYCKNTMRRGL